MGYIIISLFVLAALLFAISFLLKDPYKELREEIDQLTIQQIQDLYQIKKKLKVLEEELLVSDTTLEKQSSFNTGKKQIHDIIKNQVWSLAQQGMDINQIAKQSSLTNQEVQEIINEFVDKGQIV
jgi:Mor family transcriptional regulator